MTESRVWLGGSLLLQLCLLACPQRWALPSCPTHPGRGLESIPASNDRTQNPGPASKQKLCSAQELPAVQDHELGSVCEEVGSSALFQLLGVLGHLLGPWHSKGSMCQPRRQETGRKREQWRGLPCQAGEVSCLCLAMSKPRSQQHAGASASHSLLHPGQLCSGRAGSRSFPVPPGKMNQQMVGSGALVSVGAACVTRGSWASAASRIVLFCPQDQPGRSV